jgi:hypothetical protein
LAGPSTGCPDYFLANRKADQWTSADNLLIS